MTADLTRPDLRPPLPPAHHLNIHHGHHPAQEEEAARSFDRAAIRLRGNRAKLNFGLSEYMDENGQLIEDPRLSVSGL